MDDKSKATLDTAFAFMTAMGSGDTAAMEKLMADGMVWENEGDKEVPWIGIWKGKKEIFAFLKTFGQGAKPTMWENGAAFADGGHAAVFGRMALELTKSGKNTGPFNFAVHVEVAEGKIKRWTWFEDSHLLSRTYHAGQ